MIIASALTALLLLPWGTGALALSRSSVDLAAAQSRATPAVVGAKDERIARAAAHYDEGRYIEASLAFEELWRDFPRKPNFLFNAAASRRALGHYAHVVAYLTKYLALGDIQDHNRKVAQALLVEARREVVSLQVAMALPPGGTGEVTVVVQPIAHDTAGLRPELSFPARVGEHGAEVVVQLDPGSWIVRARAVGLTAEQRVDVTQAAGQRIELRPGVPPVDGSVSLASAHKLKLGFAIGGGVAAVTGVTVLVVGVVSRKGDAGCDDAVNQFDSCRKDLARSINTRDAGAAVLGIGVGLLGSGMTWRFSDPDTRRYKWIIEAAIGGLAVVGGSVWLTISSRTFNRANKAAFAGNEDEDWTAHFEGAGVAAQHAASAAVFGLGAGLITSALTGLLVQRKYGGSQRAALRTLRVDGLAGAGRAGLVLSGRF